MNDPIMYLYEECMLSKAEKEFQKLTEENKKHVHNQDVIARALDSIINNWDKFQTRTNLAVIVKLREALNKQEAEK